MKLLEKIERNQSYDYVLADTDETGTYIQRINAYTDTDAWILSRFIDKYYVDDLDISEYEDFVKENSVASRLEITDWYGIKGRVYNQYGEEMEVEIQFSIEGEQARIEDNKIIEDVVETDTSYSIVAKVGELEERMERVIYAPREVEPIEDETLKRIADVEELVKKVDNDLNALVGGSNE